MTTWYGTELFLHVVGALGFFISMALEWAAVGGLRSALDATTARRWYLLFGDAQRIGVASFMALLVPGVYMSWVVLGWRPWNTTALGVLAVIAAIALGVTATRMPAVGRAIGSELGALSPASLALLRDPALTGSIRSRAALAVGIVFMMTAKPDLALTVITVVVSSVLAIVLAVRIQPVPSPFTSADVAGDD